MEMLEKRILRYPLYTVFFIFIFGIAIAVSFPDEQLKEIATVQIQKVMGPKYKVRIEDVDLWRIAGLKIVGLSIKERVSEEEENDESNTRLPSKAFFPSVGVRLAPIQSLLNFGLAVKSQIDVEGGDIEIYFTKKISGSIIDIDLDDLDLAKTKSLTSFLGVPFFGTLDGGGEIVLNDKGLPIDGEIAFKGDKITIGPAIIETEKFPPITFLEVPQSNFGGVNLNFKIKNISSSRSAVEFTNVGFSGRDLRAELWGYIDLGKNIGSSISNLRLRTQFDEKFTKKNKLTSFLNVAQFRRGKNNNWYGFTISGRLKKIKFKGSPNAAKGSDSDPVKTPGKSSNSSNKEMNKKTKTKKTKKK